MEDNMDLVWAFVATSVIFLILTVLGIVENDLLKEQILDLESNEIHLLNEINIYYHKLYEKDLQCEVKLLNLTLEYQKGYYEQRLHKFGEYN